MDPSIISGIVGSGAGLIGGLINNAWANSRSNKQWERVNEMQDKMNAYNAPVAQMARLRAAGLNPNLVYAHGGAVMQSAVGNAPNPPNTAPIDTQGVLQMVQTIVGAMLEKDKIQANKEMHSESIKSQEGMQEKSIQSQEGMQEKSIQSQEGMQEKSIQSQEDIASANRAENARQFDEDLQRRIFEYNSNYKLDELLVKSQVAKNYSDIDINNQRVVIERAQYRMAARLASLKQESDFDALQAQKISNYFDRPIKYSAIAVHDFFTNELGIPINYQDATLFADSHNDMVGAIAVQNWSRNSYPGVVWDVISGPVKAVLGAVK